MFPRFFLDIAIKALCHLAKNRQKLRLGKLALNRQLLGEKIYLRRVNSLRLFE